MAFEEREYWLKKHGWKPTELKGCRKSLEPIIYNPKEFRRTGRNSEGIEILPKVEFSQKAKRDIFWTFAIVAFWIVLILSWRYLF